MSICIADRKRFVQLDASVCVCVCRVVLMPLWATFLRAKIIRYRLMCIYFSFFRFYLINTMSDNDNCVSERTSERAHRLPTVCFIFIIRPRMHRCICNWFLSCSYLRYVNAIDGGNTAPIIIYPPFFVTCVDRHFRCVLRRQKKNGFRSFLVDNLHTSLTKWLTLAKNMQRK